MITVLLLYKTGGDFDERYVANLAKAVRRNLDADHEIRLLTDVTDDVIAPLLNSRVIDRRDNLSRGLPGWWAKMELFRFPGPALYMDLDTVVTGDLSEIATLVTEATDELIMLKGFYRSDRCSGLMGWNADFAWLFSLFMDKYVSIATFRVRPHALHMVLRGRSFRGDQEWLQYVFTKERKQRVVLVQDVVSGVYSYKVHIRETGALPRDARIVCFHGHPRPHEVFPVPEWMKEHWFDIAKATQ